MIATTERAMVKKKLDGIFCLEGEWDPLLTGKASVAPQLRMLKDLQLCKGVIHKDVATREEFTYYTSKWTQKRYADYRLAYLAFHGSKSQIELGRDSFTLTEMAKALKGRAGNRIIYFGSCQTLAAPKEELIGFCKLTGAKAVVGYTKPVGWLASASFDFLLLPELLSASSMKPLYNRMVKNHRGYAVGLGLRMATADWVSPMKIAPVAGK
jgi:hypothetical protein